LTSDSYTRERRSSRADYARDGRAWSIGPGFAMVLVISFVATALLLILSLVYYAGSSARIASDYTTVASPANRALTAEVDGYSHNRRRDLAAARSDLTREVRTVGSFDDQLATVSFPSAAATAAGALIQADQKLAKLIGLQVRAPSLRKMRSFDGSVEAAAAVVKTQAGLIRRALGLPPSSGPLF
jgi:hypothetical protein